MYKKQKGMGCKWENLPSGTTCLLALFSCGKSIACLEKTRRRARHFLAAGLTWSSNDTSHWQELRQRKGVL